MYLGRVSPNYDRWFRDSVTDAVQYAVSPFGDLLLSLETLLASINARLAKIPLVSDGDTKDAVVISGTPVKVPPPDPLPEDPPPDVYVAGPVMVLQDKLSEIIVSKSAIPLEVVNPKDGSLAISGEVTVKGTVNVDVTNEPTVDVKNTVDVKVSNEELKVRVQNDSLDVTSKTGLAVRNLVTDEVPVPIITAGVDFKKGDKVTRVEVSNFPKNQTVTIDGVVEVDITKSIPLPVSFPTTMDVNVTQSVPLHAAVDNFPTSTVVSNLPAAIDVDHPLPVTGVVTLGADASVKVSGTVGVTGTVDVKGTVGLTPKVAIPVYPGIPLEVVGGATATPFPVTLFQPSRTAGQVPLVASWPMWDGYTGGEQTFAPSTGLSSSTGTVAIYTHNE